VIGNAGLADANDQISLYFGILALSVFRSKHNNHLPLPFNKKDSEELIEIVESIFKSIVGENCSSYELNKELLKLLSLTSYGDCAPVASVGGGFVANQIFNGLTHVYNPLTQWVCVDLSKTIRVPHPSCEDASIEIPYNNRSDVSISSFIPGCRYDGLIPMIGRKSLDELKKKRIFVVGAGAIGCEHLKNMGLSGIGKVVVTDMDSIELSNLSRQFLFRNDDVKNHRKKSEVAKKAVEAMNKDIRIEARIDRVGKETENIYDDDFYKDTNAICLALDNAEARNYMIERSKKLYNLKHSIPVFESGTEGIIGNTFSILPGITDKKYFNDNQRTFALCTVTSSPYLIQHTIEYAQSLFKQLFGDIPRTESRMISDFEKFKKKALENDDENSTETLRIILEDFVNVPRNIEDCVRWAKELFEIHFNNKIKEILKVHPKGDKHWKSGKQAPIPLDLDLCNDLHMDFILSASSLRKEVFGIDGIISEETIKNLLNNNKINYEKKDIDKDMLRNDIITKIESLLPSSSSSSSSSFSINGIDFEKDDDSNHHIDFISSCANNRAVNFGIRTTTKDEVKHIAGRIIPALSTTTAATSGIYFIYFHFFIFILFYLFSFFFFFYFIFFNY
jgi:ubiquitin-activating enzyme E1